MAPLTQKIAMLGLAVLATGFTAACTPRPLVERLAPDKDVRYEIDSSGLSSSANNVTYAIDNGTQQETDVTLPWSKDFTIGGGGFHPLVVTAQNTGDGYISCRILVNGSVVSVHTSTGKYAVVVCSGS